MGIVAAFTSRQATAGPGVGAECFNGHTIRLRLTKENYRRLRQYAMDMEGLTGRRVAHQTILATALAEYLDRKSPTGR
jgi:hypothetical protein